MLVGDYFYIQEEVSNLRYQGGMPFISWGEKQRMKSLLVLFSYHHNNTEKIASVFAEVLDAEIKTPQQINPEELQEYGLIGFGSGICR